MTTPRTPAESISSCTVRFWTWQRAKVTRTPTSRNSRAYQIQTNLGTWYAKNSRLIHPAAEPNSPGPTTSESPATPPTCTANGEASVTIKNTTSAHSYTQDYLAMALVMSSSALETNRGDALSKQID